MPVYFSRALGLAAAVAWFGAFSASDFGSKWPYLVASVGALIIFLIQKKITIKFALVLLLIGALFFSYALFAKPKPTDHDLSRYNGSNAVFRLELADDPKPFGARAYSCSANPVEMIFPRPKPLNGKIQLVFSDRPLLTLKSGAFLEVKASLEAPQDPVEPWKFQTRDFLDRQSIFCIATTKGGIVQLSTRPRQLYELVIGEAIALAAMKRRAILQAHSINIGTTYAALLQSIVLGDKTTALPKEIKNAFRHVGLSHVTAASGFNLTVVVGIAYWLTRLVSKTGALKQILPIGAIGLFVLMAGPSPSVVRAALCCSTFLLAAQLRRKFSPLAVISLSMLLSLAFEPVMATDVGAELSYAATFGIICLAKNVSSPTDDDLIKKNQFNFSKARRWFLDSLSVLLAVQASVLPIQLTYFWQSGLAFLPANLLVEPVIAPLTIAGFISSFLIGLAEGPLSALFTAPIWSLDQFACLLIKFILWVVHCFNHFPNAVINFGPPAPVQVFCYYLVVLLLLQSLKTRRNLVLVGIFYLCALKFLLDRPPLPEPIVCVCRDFVGLVGTDRKGFYVGEPEAAEKFLAYYGAHAEAIACPIEPSAISTWPIANGIQSTRWSIALAGSKADRPNRDQGKEPNYMLILDRLPGATNQTGKRQSSYSVDHGHEQYALKESDLTIKISPSWHVRHDRRFSSDGNHPFTLFLNRGLTVDFGRK